MKYPRLNLINRSFVIAWLGCLLACTSLFAAPLAPPAPQLKLIQRRTDQGTLHLYQMNVTPAAEPVPAFRYRLTVMPHETKPGNAVTRLLRCLGENTLTNIYKYTYDELGDDFDKLYTPSDQIPLDKLKDIDGKLDLLAEHFVKLAAYSREIDWGIEEEDFRGIETIGFLLPTAQETRDISRLLMIRARLQIAERRYDDAIETLKRNFRIAQTVSEMKFLVSGLIGIAEVGMGHRVIADLIAAEDSPNLYWALAELPTPMIDLRESLRMETSIFLRLFPSLMDVESKQLTPQEWAAEYRELFDYPGVISGLVPGDSSPAGLQYSQVAAVPLGIVNYPVAKRRLVEQAKMDPEVVRQMPVGQVLLIDTVREYQKLANEHEKSLYFPVVRRPKISRKPKPNCGKPKRAPILVSSILVSYLPTSCCRQANRFCRHNFEPNGSDVACRSLKRFECTWPKRESCPKASKISRSFRSRSTLPLEKSSCIGSMEKQPLLTCRSQMGFGELPDVLKFKLRIRNLGNNR